MRAGSLRNKAAVYTPGTTVSDLGEIEATFDHLGTYACAAHVTPTTSESNASGTVISKTRFEVTFRYYETLALIPRSSYLIIKGITLDVISVVNTGMMNKSITMICEQRD